MTQPGTHNPRPHEWNRDFACEVTMSVTSQAVPELAEVLSSRRWMLGTNPFRYVIAKDVFLPNFYFELAAEFQRILDRGFAAKSEQGRFARSANGYDAYTMGFPADLSGPFTIFLSRRWHDLLATLFDVQATGDVAGGLHHHAVGSASGKVHNDLNPGWFGCCADDREIRISDPRLCNYYTGETYRVDLIARETVRAIAVIFYLNNPPWRLGDGGQTGLYRSRGDRIEMPAVAIPPINNSLLAFECTPHSYHGFITNPRYPRNSMILWLHRSKGEAVSLWGRERIVRWTMAMK